jgi:cyclophilin family peptidyl-prolyl cis-trans isomerase
VFQVSVEDADGFTAMASNTVKVTSAVDVEAPRLIFVAEPATLSTTVNAAIPSPSYLWEAIEGTASFSNPTASETQVIATLGETLLINLTVSFANEDGDNVSLTREVEIVATPGGTPRVLIETNVGDLTIELDAEAAPLTTANFLAYVDDGFYDGVLIHRAVCTEVPGGPCDPFVIQGGGFIREGAEVVGKEPTRDPIESEADNGLSNAVLYSVAMALSAGNRDSATTQFFINLGENDFLDDQGFTVFGLVVEGREVVDEIVLTEVVESPAIPGEVSLPAEDIIMERVIRIVP